MKKYLGLLFLFLLPLALAACSDDEEYVDLQIPGKSIEGIVEITGSVYNQDGIWYLDTDDLCRLANFKDRPYISYDIKVKSIPDNISFEEIENAEKVFTIKLILYHVEYYGPCKPNEEYPIATYHYVADIYEVSY